MILSSAVLISGAIGPLLLGVVLQFLLSSVLSARGKGYLAVLCCSFSLIAVLAAYGAISSGYPLEWCGAFWDGPLLLAFHVDALSLLFALMASGLGLIVLFYSIDYMAEERSATRFYALMLTFIAGLVCMVYSANLFLFYLCWEAMGLCSFNLVGFWYKNREAVVGARKVLLTTHLAGYGLLASILLIASKTHNALWTDPSMSKAFTGGVFSLMLVSLLAKSVQFPLHTWIPDAMAAPTPVSALLHAACYVKAGVYLAARMHSFGPWPVAWNEVMLWIGTISMVVGVAFAMVQHDLKRMLAFHTVSQIGYMITGIGIGTPLGITAGLLHCLSHGFFKGGLFLAAGAVQHATGTRDMNELGGLSRRMPRTTVIWLLSVGSMMGVPLLNGFTSKWLLYTAALQSGRIVPALAAWMVSVGTVFSCVKATSSVFLGAPTERTEQAHEAPFSMLWGLGLIGGGSVVLGVFPQLAVRYIIHPILPAVGLTSSVLVSPLGLVSAGSSGWSMGAFALVLLPLLLGGGLVYGIAHLAHTFVVGGNVAFAGGGASGGVFTGGEKIAGPDRMSASDFSAVLRRQWDPFFRWGNVDRYYAALWKWLDGFAARLMKICSWFEVRIFLSTLVAFAILLSGLRYFFAAAPSAFHPAGERLPFLLFISCALAAAGLVSTVCVLPKWRTLTTSMLSSAVCALAGMYFSQPLIRVGFLELATALSLVLVWQYAGSSQATGLYGLVAVLSGCSLVAGQVFLYRGDIAWASALLGSGFLLKLAIVPMLLWLPKIAEALPSVVLGFLIAVLDIAAFAEVLLLAQTQPWLFAPKGVWLGLAIASSLLGGGLMLAEKNLKRLLVLSTIEDMGFLLLGIVSGSSLGIEGALVGASVHAVAKALLFVSLAVPESEGALAGGGTALAARYPVSAAGFLIGMLTVLGIPPTLGYAGRWRLFAAASDLGPAPVALCLVASMLALQAYIRALTCFWWGPEVQALEARKVKEPFLLRMFLIGVSAILLIAGAWPKGILDLIGGIR